MQIQILLLSHVQLCKPVNSSLSGSSVHGTVQARILEWVAISSSRGSSWPRDRTHVPVSSTEGSFFTHWAIEEVLSHLKKLLSNIWFVFRFPQLSPEISFIAISSFWLKISSRVTYTCDCWVSLLSFDLDQNLHILFLCFSWCWSFKEFQPVFLANLPYSGLSDYFLMIRFRLNTFRKDTFDT